MARIQITSPFDSDHAFDIVYIGIAPPDLNRPALTERMVMPGRLKLWPGESTEIDLIRGHSSISIHEADPVIKLLPVSDTKKDTNENS